MAAKYKIMVSEALSGQGRGAHSRRGTDFKKRGAETPGIGRQYLGSVGKAGSGVAFVVASYPSDRWVAAIGYGQFFQEEWDTQEHAKKREKPSSRMT
jgi:SRSO17 transposase